MAVDVRVRWPRSTVEYLMVERCSGLCKHLYSNGQIMLPRCYHQLIVEREISVLENWSKREEWKMFSR